MKDCYRIVCTDEVMGDCYEVTPWFLSKKKLFAVYGESVVKDWLEDAGMPEDYPLDKALSDLMRSAETERYYSWLEIEVDSICLEEDENE